MSYADPLLAPYLLSLLEPYVAEEGRRPLPYGVGASDLLHLASVVMGDDLVVYPHGEMLVWDIARHEGYDIPPYPLAGCGEAQEFLADYGVHDVPGWYELRGVSRSVSSEFFAYGCVMARNGGLWRRVWAVPTAELEQAPTLAAWLAEGIRFALGEQTDAEDARLFRC